jgi:hypothetical protein
MLQQKLISNKFIEKVHVYFLYFWWIRVLPMLGGHAHHLSAAPGTQEKLFFKK